MIKLKNICQNKLTKGGSMELERIKEIVAGVLHVDENSITPDTKFVDDLGADSLDLTSIVMEIEEQFGIEIPDDAIASIVTVGDAVEKLEEASEQ